MTSLARLAHILLVLSLIVLLVRTVYYGFSLLWVEQFPQQPFDDVSVRKPSPQEIVSRASHRSHVPKLLTESQAASMNTFWNMWDEDHCKNICEASWIACRLRQCDSVPGVRRPDEL
jgi:hypothetical protein